MSIGRAVNRGTEKREDVGPTRRHALDFVADGVLAGGDGGDSIPCGGVVGGVAYQGGLCGGDWECAEGDYFREAAGGFVGDEEFVACGWRGFCGEVARGDWLAEHVVNAAIVFPLNEDAG